jgi:signal transduction histidine kinase
MTIEPLFDPHENIIGTMMSAMDITARKQGEAKSRELTALEERQRLARDLHDSVNQTLFTISLIADSLPQLRDKNPDRMWNQIEELRQLSQFAMAEMRTLLLDLRPANVTKTNLVDLFTQLIHSVQARRDIDIICEVNIEQPISEDAHIALYRIVQEALNNISKHSDADQGRITLNAGANGIQLRIWDNGHGFDTAQSASGMGLGVMRERALYIGASFEVASNPDRGTEILISGPAL